MREFKSLINETLNKSTSSKLKEFQDKLITTKYEILGVKIEVDKKLAKTINKEDLQDIMEYLNKPSFSNIDEVYIYGFVLAYCNINHSLKKKFLKNWLLYVDNWANCDMVCDAFKDIYQYQEDYYQFVVELVNSEHEYQKRFGIVSLMNYYLDDNHIDKVLYIIKNIKDDRYYVKMAVAWFMATSLSIYWDKTLDIIYNKELPLWIHNKSIQKAIESHRITKEEKMLLKGLKR